MLSTLFSKARARSQAAVEPLEDRKLMSTYYVSLNGKDTNSGTSASAAWKTIAKVNSVTIKPGDSVLFQGGQTFSGSLSFSSSEGGSASSEVTIGSYAGTATISSGTSDGARVFNTGGFLFENLIFSGTPGAATQYGIDFETNAAGVKRPNVGVNDCTVTGYTGSGIMVMGDESTAGFANVVITNNVVHDNVDCGIETLAHAERVIDNVIVSHNAVYSNYGDGVSAVTGSGIELGDVQTAMVEHNIAYLNGWKGGNGGVGIWAYESDSVTFQYNESCNNHGLRGEDGDGFDFDADTSNSIMQYNFAADNDGTGFQLDQWRNNGLFTGDIVRFNYAEDDGNRNSYGSLEVWGRVINATLYSNTIYTAPAKNGGTTSGIRVYNNTINGLYALGVHFGQNTIFSTGGVPFINVPSAEVVGSSDVTFTADVFDCGTATPVFIFNGVTYHSLVSFANATGREKTNGTLTAVMSSAAINAPPVAAPLAYSSAPVTGSPILIASSTAYIVTSASALFSSASLENLLVTSI